jgi:anti-sigma-K factor RskA
VNVHEFAELAAGYALDALSPEDAEAFEAALAEHPEWASIVETDAATVADLATEVTEVQPPAHVRGALLAAIAGRESTAESAAAAPTSEPSSNSDPSPSTEPPLSTEPSPNAEPSPRTEPPLNTEAIQTVARRTWTRGLLALAASFILLIALGAAAVTIGDRLWAPASVAALEEIQAAEDAQTVTAEVEGGGTATAYWSESLGQAVIVTTGVESAPRGETYETWFVRDGGTPVSAGQFDTDSSGAATVALDGTVEEGDVIAVTVEPDGGSPTGEPTSEPIVALPTA